MRGRFDSQVDVLGHSQSSLPGPLGQLSIRHRLQTPGDTAKQELLVIGARRPPEHFQILRLQLPDGGPPKSLNFVPHRWFPSGALSIKPLPSRSCERFVNALSHERSDAEGNASRRGNNAEITRARSRGKRPNGRVSESDLGPQTLPN